MTYALYHLKIGDRTVELSHRSDIHPGDLRECDEWLNQHRADAYHRRGRLAEMKETHGCGDRPEWRIDQ